MSEQEMLLLSNFVYMDISADEMNIGESINRFRNDAGKFDAKSVSSVGIGGAMTAEETADLFNRIDEMPDEFKNLYPSKVVNDSDLRGVCYTTSKSDTGKGCVVFRGTGGTYDAWEDNVLGQCRTDTAIQKKALDFVEDSCACYSDLTICGHSKGGNLAMYATVMSTASISKCVSFDGQGFSEDFVSEYSDKIAASKDKIKSVCAYNDYVNVLLYPIAGETVYTENDGKGLYGHSSYYMYISNQYDENGNIISTRDQSLISKALDELTDGVSERLNGLPGDGNRDFSGLLAAMVAGILSSDKSASYETVHLMDSAASVGNYLMGGTRQYSFPVTGAIKLASLSNEATYEKFMETGDEIENIGNRLSGMSSELGALSERTDPYNKIDCYISERIGGIREKIKENVRTLKEYSDTLKNIGRLYAVGEKAIEESISSS